MSKGVAIGSSIYIDHDTHIEATRYQSGSDAMGLMCTYMAKENGLDAYFLLVMGTHLPSIYFPSYE